MITLSRKRVRYSVVVTVLVLAVVNLLQALAHPYRVAAYSYYCTSDACHAAEDAYNAAVKQLAEANSQIGTLKGEIAALEAENASLEASLRADRAILADLKNKIAETETKITRLKTSLASVIIDDHFDKEGDDVITILASSKTIGDIAEKNARSDTAKDRIALYSGEIEAAKAELESQKAVSESKIVEQEAKQQQISTNKATITAKLAGLNRDASTAKDEAERQKAIVDAAKRSAMEAQSSSGVSVYIDGYYNTYPYHYSCPSGLDSRLVVGGYMCECVSYAGWKVQEAYGIYISGWGNALDWDETARRQGYRVDTEPEVGSVAVSHYGGYGHVMWVEDVHDNGTIDITEYNYKVGSFTARNIPLYGNYGYTSSWQSSNPRSYYYTRYGSQPWARGYTSTRDHLYFIHFR